MHEAISLEICHLSLISGFLLCSLRPFRLSTSARTRLPLLPDDGSSDIIVVLVTRLFHYWNIADARKAGVYFNTILGIKVTKKERGFLPHLKERVSTSSILIKKASKDLLGHHNFSSFANKKAKNPFCTIFNIEINLPQINEVIFDIIGDKFLYKMVRNIVGTLAFIGSKRMDKDIIPNLLEYKNRKNIGMTAPAHGLTLQKVFYS